MEEMSKIPYRHGDWVFIPTDVAPATRAEPHEGLFVFGEGEGAGHLHEALAESPADMRWHKDGDSWIAQILAPIKLRHPQHSAKGDLTLEPGTYVVMPTREKDWFSGAVRKVID